MGNITLIKPHEGFQERFVRSNVDVVVGGGQLSVGKQQPLFSNILTENGWIKMQDVKIGTRMFAPFGGESVVTNIFPQGVKDVYEIETLDGRKTLAGPEHLWNIVTKKQKAKHAKDNVMRWITMETQEVIRRMERGEQLFLPIANPQDCEDKDFKIDPYVLGILIGDGCLTRITERYGLVKISNDEEDIIKKVADLLKSEYRLHGKSGYTNVVYCDWICKEIIRLGLNVYSHEKFIPKEYLYGSKKQRLDLLKGLMDSDGYISDKNSFNFTTTAPKLKEGFTYLCRSLGYSITWCRDKRTKYASGECWGATIKTNDIIFSSEKHLAKHEYNYNKYQKGNKNCRKNNFLRIKSIKYVGKHECQCIMVTDKNNLYVTDDFIVTHNSFAAILSVAEYLSIPNFRAVFIRKQLSEVKVAGGLYDEFKKLYGGFSNTRESDSPRVTFPCGSWVDFTHVSDERPSQFLERVKGWQYDFIYLDEATSYQYNTFQKIMTRNRGSAGIGSKIRMTTNPHNKHWIKKMVQWYIGPDGFIRPERDGCVRYFYAIGENVEDLVWGNSKKEVYLQCKENIDRKLRKLSNGKIKFTYENLIKSFVFYGGSISDNVSLIGQNKDYVGSIAASGGKSGEQLLEGNWNVDPNEQEDAPITSKVANSVFNNDKQVNGDMWITVDLADYGTDNYVALIWNGFHIVNFVTMGTSRPRDNANRIKQLQQQYDIADSHVIYDATGSGRYFSDYIEESIPFISNRKPFGNESLNHVLLKDECYSRLVYMINNGLISFEEGLGEKLYKHQKIHDSLNLRTEFIEECTVVRWNKQANGKKRLMNKKEMNAMLGRGRSMDLLDPMAMRMYPILHSERGDELYYEVDLYDRDDEEYEYIDGRMRKVGFDMYNDDDWA